MYNNYNGKCMIFLPAYDVAVPKCCGWEVWKIDKHMFKAPTLCHNFKQK